MYLDLWVMSIWNQYRAARIKIQSIILSCIAALKGPQHEAAWYWRGVYASMIVQEMADEICSSVPFALGTKTFGGAGERAAVEFPSAAAAAAATTGSPAAGGVSEEHKRGGECSGGMAPPGSFESMSWERGKRRHERWADWLGERADGEDWPGSTAFRARGGGGGPAGSESMFDRSSFEFPV